MMKHNFRFILFILLTFWLAVSGAGAPYADYTIVISFDGFRWDYLNRGLTPNLQKLTERGVRALSLEPVFPSKTFPNHYSIVTGLYPQNHGIISNYFENPHTGKVYRLGDSSAVRDDSWYLGEAIWARAKREGIKTACYFWPGSETRLLYRHPDYYAHYDDDAPHETRVDGIMHWLTLPAEQRPHLLFLYFSDTDTQGHRYGPDSEEVNAAIQKLDSTLGFLQQKLAALNLLNKTNIIILSDHGMSRVQDDPTIDLSGALTGYKVKREGNGGPLLQIYIHDKSQAAEILHKLRGSVSNGSVYSQSDMPQYFHYDAHPWIGDIIVLANPGYRVFAEESRKDKDKKHYSKGDHGYDPRDLEMHGIFVAAGPAFTQNYQTGTLRNVDVFPMLCRILGLSEPQNIDGELERIEHILIQP